MKPFKPIKVYKWNSLLDKTLYVFNNIDNNIKNGINIPDIIYSDDNIEDAINKIGLYIQSIDKKLKFPIYVWNNEKSLLFDIQNKKWNGYNINPFKSKDIKNKLIDEPINYIYNNAELFNYNFINIIFNNDIEEFKNNKYYFINRQIPSIEQYKKRDKKMKLLEDIDIKNISLLAINYHRYDLFYKLKTKKILSDIFDGLHTNNIISLIQWVNDPSKILYKLHKYHKISLELLNNWTNIEKLTKFRCINLYSLLTNNTYCKIVIDEDGIINISYIIDLRHSINWLNINKHKDIITKILEIGIKQSIKLQDKSLKINLLFEQDNSNMEILVKKIGEYIDIFEILKINKEKDKYTINCIYKRTSNYNKQGLDISNYIKSRLELGISDSDLIIELFNLNFNKDEAIKLIKEQKDIITDIIIDKKDINKDIDTIIIIELYKTGYLINIYNIPNKIELDYLIYWLIRILSLSRDIKKKIKIIKEKSPSPIQSSTSSKKTNSSEDLGKLDYSDIPDISGGAIGKDKHSYFVNLLQHADKDLFANNYARDKCQAVNQPIVLSKEQLNKIKEDKNYFFDNMIEYGSKPDIKNFYSCPRLWCPQSKIPLNPDNPDNKCPIENEEPMELFFDKDRNKKRYVKLIKPNENGICVPCCFKKEPKEEDLNKCKNYGNIEVLEKKEEIIIEQNKDENYIMNQIAPINVGRYGVIPQLLHELLFPKVEFTLCSKILNKTDKCFVRKGINHRNNKKNGKYITNDSIINSIVNNLNFKSKDLFIKDIIEKLDLITYISLENGEICKIFMDELPLIPEENIKLYKNLKIFLNKFDITKNLFKNYNISRLLSIYKSYIKYIDYLSSDNYPTNKSPYYLYSLLSILYEVLLVVWEKSDKDLNILCPYYSCFEDIIASMNYNPNVLMLLKEKKYYEPIELKLRGEEGEKLIKLNDFDNIKKLINQCSVLKKSFDFNNKIYNNLYTLNLWIKSKILKNSKKFIIDSVIINNDLTIDRFLTNGNILLIINPISISFLPKLIKDLNIINILFYDDLINIKYKINVLISDLELFSNKIKDLDIKFDLGIINKDIINNDIEYYTTLILNKRSLNNNIIHVRNIDDLYKLTTKNNNKSKKWFQLQLYVANTLINKLDNIKINELLKENKKDRIFKLLNYFHNNSEINKIQIILEEIPLFSINHITNYINNIIYYNKYFFKYTNNIIDENKKEFIFSQLSLLNGIPNKLLLYHPSNPNNTLNNSNTEEYIIDNKNNDEILLPDIYNGNKETLKTKWIMHKKSKWYNYIILKNTNYNENTIPNFYNWFSNILGIKSDYNEIKKISNIKLFEILDNKDGMFEILDDISYFNEWNFQIKKKYKSITLFWDNYYSITSHKEHIDYLNIIIKSNKLYPNDINLLSISELLNINILIIHRGHYGKFGASFVRGDIEDLVLSSTFFKSHDNYENRPLIIFSKSNDNYKSLYYMIIENTDNISFKSIYMNYKNDVPLNVKYLIEEHLKK